jgi:hypothetical protein
VAIRSQASGWLRSATMQARPRSASPNDEVKKPTGKLRVERKLSLESRERSQLGWVATGSDRTALAEFRGQTPLMSFQDAAIRLWQVLWIRSVTRVQQRNRMNRALVK